MEKFGKYIWSNPKIQFGQPVIKGTRIFPETIYSLYLGGEKISFIAELYDLTIKQVEAAICYCEKDENGRSKK